MRWVCAITGFVATVGGGWLFFWGVGQHACFPAQGLLMALIGIVLIGLSERKD